MQEDQLRGYCSFLGEINSINIIDNNYSNSFLLIVFYVFDFRYGNFSKVVGFRINM